MSRKLHKERFGKFSFSPKKNPVLHQMCLTHFVLFLPSHSSQKATAARRTYKEPSPSKESLIPVVDLRSKALTESAKSWADLGLRAATQEEANKLCSSVLEIDTPSGIKIASDMAVEEIYSSFGLETSKHLRKTCPPGHHKTLGSHYSISKSDPSHVSPNNEFAVVRPGDSSIFDRYRILLDDMPNMDKAISQLIRAVYRFGKTDNTRSEPITNKSQPKSRQHRINIGLVGQNRKDKDTIVGSEFISAIEKSGEFDKNEILDTIGRHSLFVWLAMQQIQELANDSLLGPDANRSKQFSSRLQEILGIDPRSGFCAEDITVSVGVLYPNFDGCGEHEDVMNDWRPGYRRTGVYNKIICTKDGETLLHLQVCLEYTQWTAN